MKKIDIVSVYNKIEKQHPREYKDYLNFLKKDTSINRKEYDLLISSPEYFFKEGCNLRISRAKKEVLYKKYDSRAKSWKVIKELFLDEILKEVKFCPYCGKVPLLSFQEEGIIKNFDLDHFFPRSVDNNKILAAVLYNLIPSCKSCNFIKKASFPVEGYIFHPYFGWYNCGTKTFIGDNEFNDKFNFSKIPFQVNKGTQFEKHLDFFHLNEIYYHSKCTENELTFLKNLYEKVEDYKRKLHGFNPNDLMDILINSYLTEDEKKFLEYSNAKLKLDLRNYLFKIK